MFASSVKNLAQAISNREIFPGSQGHGDDLHPIRVVLLFPFRVIAFTDNRHQTGIRIRQYLNTGLAIP